jgi:hypothetical protein
MAKLPLWLNTDTGVVIGANSRPNGFVKVVLVEVNGETIHSTLDALYKLISFDSPRHKIPLADLEIKDTSIKSYGSPDDNKWWEQTLVDFPYINLSMDEHTILTITYQQIQADANGTQATTGREEDGEDETLPGGRGGGGGGGEQEGQGEPNGEGEGEGGEPSEESGDGEATGERPIEGEDGDPYQQGKDKGSQLAEDKKGKMQELMDKAKGGAPAEAGEGGKGEGQGQGESGEQGDGESGQGEGGGEGGEGEDADSGKGQGDGDGDDDESESGEGDTDSDDNPLKAAVAGAKRKLEETKKEMYSGNPSWAQKNADKAQSFADSAETIAAFIDGDDNAMNIHGKDKQALEFLRKKWAVPNTQKYVDEAQNYADEAKRIADGGEFEYDEGLDPLEQAVQDAEDAKDEAKDAAQRADGDEAQEAADDAQQAADLANEIAEQIGDEEAEEMAEQAQDAADEAQEAADAAKELEEMIKEMFEEEENLDEEDYEDFKQGVLDSLNEDGEETDEDAPTPQDLGKSGREGVYTSNYGSKKRKGRKYVNWETGEIRLFSPTDKIGPNWLEVTKFFSGVYDGGSEIVVDRTIGGAAELVNRLGGNTKNQTSTSFTIVNGDSQIINLLNKMRMFMVSGNEVSY